MGAIWFSLLARDLLQVAFSGTALVPDLTVFAIVWLSVFRCEDATPLFIPAFLAGLFWDLRWTALPGMTAAAYSLTVAASAWAWFHLSTARRGNPVLFFLWAVAAHAFSTLLPALFSGKGLGLSPSLATQQGMAVACALVLTALFIRCCRISHD
jgi:cell shape-determining protein MreD